MRIEWLFNRRLLALSLGLLIAAGLSAVQTLPRAEDPYLIARNATVLAPYPGATPEQIEALVAGRLSKNCAPFPRSACWNPRLAKASRC